MSESLTAMTGKRRTPSRSMARRRMTPVVVSSVEPSTRSRSRRQPSSPMLRGERPHLRVHAVELAARHEQHRRHEVGAVVHGDRRLKLETGPDVPVVARVVLALDGEGLDAVDGHERRRHVVLGGQRVGGAQAHLGAARHQGAHEVGGLAGDVQAGGQALAGQGLLPSETLADRGQHRHVAVGPGDAARTGLGQLQIQDVSGCRLMVAPLTSRASYTGRRLCATRRATAYTLRRHVRRPRS